MTKFVDSLGLKRLVTKIAEAVSNGTWLPVKVGRNAEGKVMMGAVVEGHNTTASGVNSHAEGNHTTASGDSSHAEGEDTSASDNCSHAEGMGTKAIKQCSHAEGGATSAGGGCSHAEGFSTTSSGYASHAEGICTNASGTGSHAEGHCNYDDPSFVHTIGVGEDPEDGGVKKNAVVVYIAYNEDEGIIDPTNQKNGYQYLLDVGGYKGQEIGNAKSVQEVIADLEKGVAATETMTVEEIREIISA